MKKQLLRIMMMLTICLCLLPLTVLAADGDNDPVVHIGNKMLHDGDYLNKDGIITPDRPEDGCAYYKDGTLYLNDFNFDVANPYEVDGFSAAIYAEDSLTISLSGYNCLYSHDYTYVIAAASDLTITGSGELVIDATTEPDPITIGTVIGMLGSDADLTIKSGYLKTNPYEYNITVQNFITAFNNVTISGGEVSFDCDDDGIAAGGDVTISGGNVSLDSDVGIAAEGDITISDGNISLDSNVGISADRNATISGGTVSIYGDYGIAAGGNVTINGGTVSIDGNVGIATIDDITADIGDFGDVTISGGTVSLCCDACGIIADTVDIKDGSAVFITYGTEAGIAAHGSVTIDGDDSNPDDTILDGTILDIRNIDGSGICCIFTAESAAIRGGTVKLMGAEAGILVSQDIVDSAASAIIDFTGGETYISAYNGPAIGVLGYEIDDPIKGFEDPSAINMGEGLDVNQYGPVFYISSKAAHDEAHTTYYQYYDSGHYTFCSDSSCVNSVIPLGESESHDYVDGVCPCGYTETSEDDKAPVLGGVVLSDGTYLTNDEMLSKTQPASGGYAYYKDGVLTLNNFIYAGSYDKTPALEIPSDLTVNLIGRNILRNYWWYAGCGITISDNIELEFIGTDKENDSLLSLAYSGYNSYDSDNSCYYALKNLTIENCDLTFGGYSSIDLGGEDDSGMPIASSMTITDSTLTLGDGIDLYDGDMTIEDSTLTLGDGIYLADGDMTIEDSTLTLGGYIELYYGSMDITDSTLTLGDGIYLDRDGDLTIEDSTLTLGGYIELSYGNMDFTDSTLTLGDGIYLDGNGDMTVSGSELTLGNGIYLADDGDMTVSGSELTISSNYDGIYLATGILRITNSNVDITSEGAAIVVYGSNPDNAIILIGTNLLTEGSVIGRCPDPDIKGVFFATILGSDGKPVSVVQIKDNGDPSVQPGDLVMTVEQNDVRVGETIIFEITFTNTTGAPANVTITDELHPNVEFKSATHDGTEDEENGTVTWTLLLGPGETVKVTLTVTAVEAGPGTNRAIATVNGTSVSSDAQYNVQASIDGVPGSIVEGQDSFDYEYWYWMLMMLYNQEYKITASASEGGAISPAGVSKVKFDRNFTYTITPDEGYAISAVLVNGEDVGAVTEYTFKRVRKAQTIEVVFEKLKPQNPFTDVSENDWFYEDAQYVYENGLMLGTGTEGTVFSPDETVTRATLVTILWRAAGQPIAESPVDFSDVPANEWYSDAIAWAAANGIVLGNGDGTFGTNDLITREQLAAILYRYEQHLGGGFTGLWMFRMDYADLADVSDWAYEATCWLTMNEIYVCREEGELDPKEEATRAETAAFLRRFCEYRMEQEEA